MFPVTPEQLAQARELDLLTYLRRYEPDELIPHGNGSYATRTHSSLKLSNGQWYWWSHGVGGVTALDYLVEVQGLSLPDAVRQILGAGPMPPAAPVPTERRRPQPFRLPPRHTDDRRVMAYLTGRGIDTEILRACIRNNQLYEDAAHHNCVFVGYDGDTPRYAALRGTYPRSAFMGEVAGSDKRFSFAVPVRAGPRQTLCGFESAIDALSYLTILKQEGRDWRTANTLSLSGVYGPNRRGRDKMPRALGQYLERNPIRRIVLCLDNDDAGRMAAQSLQRLLTDYLVLDNPPQGVKDYNDLLLRRSSSRRVRAGRGCDSRCRS